MTRVLKCAFAILLLTGPATAQEQPAEPPKAPMPQAAKQPAPSQQELGQAVNIRLEMTITDQQTTGQPVAKTVTMVVADAWQSRVRTEGSVYYEGRAYPVALNVDAKPRVVGDKILVMATVEYRPNAPDPRQGGTATTLNQSFQVLLADGKPLVVSQSADPNTERKVKLEVKATVLK